MKVLIRGGGDLASGIALRLFKSHFKVMIVEIAQPRVVRRSVAFADAVYKKTTVVEDVAGIVIESADAIKHFDFSLGIPVLIDPDAQVQKVFNSSVLIDARMLKKKVNYGLSKKPMIIGLGPGFEGGRNCHAAIETNRGHFLGRVLWTSITQEDTGIPGDVNGKQFQRVLRAPENGMLYSDSELGQLFNTGDVIAHVNSLPVIAPFDGCLRGLMHNGLMVTKNEKIGDLDPRLEPNFINYVSEKSLAIAGGVLEAILTYFNPSYQ